MTVRLQDVKIDHDRGAWILDMVRDGIAADVTNDARFSNDILAMVRHIMRERSDCTMVPVVRAVIVFPTNEWGHNSEIEVSYSRENTYRAIYGATLSGSLDDRTGGQVSRVQCYMD